MEDSFKGLIYTMTAIVIFTLAITSYITLFPLEQGYVVSPGSDNNSFLVMQGISQSSVNNTLNNMSNTTQYAFNQWNIEVGFMGSNVVKQTSSTIILSLVGNTFSTLMTMAVMLFGMNTPVTIVLSLLATAAGTIVILIIIKFVRQGE